MKKKTIFTILIICLLTIPVMAFTKDFNVDIDKVFTSDSKSKNIGNLFNKEYVISDLKQNENANKEFEELTKKTTLLLLGSSDNNMETATDYYKRKNDFYSLRYAPEIPKSTDSSNSFFGLDSSSQEYKDDLLSGFAIPGIFKKINDLEIDYDYLGDIKIKETLAGFIATVTVPKVSYKVANYNEPTKFNKVTTDLTMYYMFKQNKYKNNELQLLYLYGETTEELDDFFNEIEQNENKGVMGIKTNYDSEIKNAYDLSELDALSTDKLQKIYDDNVDKTMILSTYYDKRIVDVASGFLLTKDVLVTTWTYLESALIEGQFVSIRDKDMNVYSFEGIITINTIANIVLIKVGNCNREGVILGDSKDVKVEDAIISFSTKSGLGIAAQTGIVINNDYKFQNLMPLSKSDNGSPLFNTDGEVIGINTGESTNTSISYANYTDILKDLQNKLKDNDKIDNISFDQLKEQYYYSKTNKEVVNNNIKKSIWDKYSKIGNIESTMHLPLIKANYSNGVLSLRYDNHVKNLLGSKQMSLAFVNELKKSGYEELLNTSEKRIYQNKSYKVILMDEFNYLIIVMVKL